MNVHSLSRGTAISGCIPQHALCYPALRKANEVQRRIARNHRARASVHLPVSLCTGENCDTLVPPDRCPPLYGGRTGELR